MPILTQKIISRLDCRNNPNVLYLFGDNCAKKGYGGQAKAMRDEPNAIGVRTKNSPDWEETAYWNDDDLEENYAKMLEDLLPARKHLSQGGIVVIPADGIGTGYAKMKTYCPNTFKVLCYLLEHLEDPEI